MIITLSVYSKALKPFLVSFNSCEMKCSILFCLLRVAHTHKFFVNELTYS